jgi:short-subunit dehydrogenase
MKKKILVCGASRNLGKFLAEKYSEQLDSVIKISRSFKNNPKQNNYKCDLSSYFSTLKTLKIIKKKFQTIDTIIFAAGDSKPNLNSKNSFNKLEKSLRNNFLSLVSLIENYLKIYKGNKTNIIVISSIASIKIIDAPIEYSVSKSALNFYCKIKAKELIKYGIKLNIISPGNILMVNNNWHKKLELNKKKVMNYIFKNVPSKKFITPDIIFETCKLLSSDDNDSFIGTNFVLDGGQSL